MKRLLTVVALAFTVETSAITGDLNLDGVVDFDDFFIFADNFGLEGPPDTLRITVLDTVIVIDPVPGPYDTQEQILARTDVTDPLNNLVDTDIDHKSGFFKLGPDLIAADHEYIEVTSYENGVVYRRRYLKPSGHLFLKRTNRYDIDVHHVSEDGTYIEALYIEHVGGDETRYFFNVDMEPVGEEYTPKSSSFPVEFWYFMTLEDGKWTVLFSFSEFGEAIPWRVLDTEPLDVAEVLASNR